MRSSEREVLTVAFEGSKARGTSSSSEEQFFLVFLLVIFVKMLCLKLLKVQCFQYLDQLHYQHVQIFKFVHAGSEVDLNTDLIFFYTDIKKIY
jgi:hypothetical protein